MLFRSERERERERENVIVAGFSKVTRGRAFQSLANIGREYRGTCELLRAPVGGKSSDCLNDRECV